MTRLIPPFLPPLGLALCALLLSPNALANPELAQKKSCMACHGIDNKIVGPSFKAIAAKYAGQKDAVTQLSEKVLKGGSGVWGPAAMPANPITPEEAKTLTTWVLSLHNK